MVELMVTVSEGAYQAAWCQDLPDLLRPAVERLIAGQAPDFEIRNPRAPYADEVPDALRSLAAIAREHRIWIRETDDLSDLQASRPRRVLGWAAQPSHASPRSRKRTLEAW